MQVSPSPILSADRCYFRGTLSIYLFAGSFIFRLISCSAAAQERVKYNSISIDHLGGIQVIPPTPYQIKPVRSMSLSAAGQGCSNPRTGSPGPSRLQISPQHDTMIDTDAEMSISAIDMTREMRIAHNMSQETPSIVAGVRSIVFVGHADSFGYNNATMFIT